MHEFMLFPAILSASALLSPEVLTSARASLGAAPCTRRAAQVPNAGLASP